MKARMVVASVAVLVLGVVVSLAWAEEKSTPSADGRYRLFSAPNRQENLVFRIDTQTGDTVVLNSTSHTWEFVK